MPCAFIRLSGCNLRCWYCDTRYTWSEEVQEISVSDILVWVDQYPGVMVEITGGEPLLQDNTHTLTRELVNRGHKVLIETNGTVTLEFVHPNASIIMDIKCPESGMAEHTRWQNMEQLEKRRHGSQDEIKFVLSSPADFHWAMDKVLKYNIHELVPVLFSPVTNRFNPEKLAELILSHKLPVRLQLQLHTLLWPDQTRGV
jgi:7-carboxy-7-deazaguanine synthase